MPYAPGTHNRAGEIYAKFMGDAAMASAQLRFQGAQAMAQGMSSLGSSLGKGISSFGEKWQEIQNTKDFMGAQMDMFRQQGIVSPENYEKFQKAGYGAQQGIYTQHSALYNTWLKSQEAEAELGRTVRLRQSEADISRQGLGARTYVQDPNDPSKWVVAGTQTGSASYQPATSERESIPTQPDPIFVEGGAYGHKLVEQPGRRPYWVPDYSTLLHIKKPAPSAIPTYLTTPPTTGR